MSWFKVDDKFHSHPKAIEAGNAALGLWVRCGSWAADQLTDGFIPHAIASQYGTKPQRIALVSSGFWLPVDGGYQMHNYNLRNPTKDQVLSQRKAAAERIQRWRGNAASNAVTPPVTGDDVTPLVTPPPTRPDPTRSTSSKSTTSTTSTGVPGVVVAEAVAIYVEADVQSRSVTAIQNAASYREVTANNCYARRGAEIAAYLERRPDATAHDIATVVLGVDEFTARQIALKREAS